MELNNYLSCLKIDFDDFDFDDHLKVFFWMLLLKRGQRPLEGPKKEVGVAP